jgi:carbonic anhydrase
MISRAAEESVERLLTGISKFRREVYPQKQAAYQQLMREGQKPHALFITCSDSRVDPELLTQSSPGDIFVFRNIGNLVPAYGEMLGATSAVIEYAVLVLAIPHIVVCGHTDCGAMKGLLQREQTHKLPIVDRWLMSAEAALSVVEARNALASATEALNPLIEENVILQMNHLRTHPSVAGRIAQGALMISGWVYDIAGGEVRIYHEGERRFVPADSLRGRLSEAETQRNGTPRQD